MEEEAQVQGNLEHYKSCSQFLQGSAKWWDSGLVNFDIAVAYHFSMTLLVVFTQLGVHLLA